MAKKSNPYNVRVLSDSSRKVKQNRKGKTKTKFRSRSSSTYSDGSSVSQTNIQTTNKRGKSKSYNRVVVRNSKGNKTGVQTTRNGKTRMR